MRLEDVVYSGQIPKVRIVLFLVAEIVFFIYVLVNNLKNSKNTPIDDSKSQIDMEGIKQKLKQFMGNNQEQIIGVLGKQYVINDKKNQGFCFLTDKAYYFIGNVLQKKSLFTWKSNIQHRVVASEMKGIKIKNMYPIETILFSIYTVFILYWNIKFIFILADTEAELVNTGDKVCTVTSGVGIFIYFLCIIYGVGEIFLRRKTTIDIIFTTQTMRFPVGALGKKEIKDFYKSVSYSQETISSTVTSDNGPRLESTYDQSKNTGKNKVEALAELSKLYEQGMIGQEEFEKLKEEIING